LRRAVHSDDARHEGGPPARHPRAAQRPSRRLPSQPVAVGQRARLANPLDHFPPALSLLGASTTTALRRRPQGRRCRRHRPHEDPGRSEHLERVQEGGRRGAVVAVHSVSGERGGSLGSGGRVGSVPRGVL
ncbi:uncharacterized protein RHOBADRAFT_51845, partial [Rhodotorula graminis WP1]